LDGTLHEFDIDSVDLGIFHIHVFQLPK
jgi:hypothetical protein